MRRRLLSITICLILVLALFVGLDLSFDISHTVEAPTIYVDDDNTGLEDGSQANPWNTIQEAVDAANPGDTVFVTNGTYYENVVVNKMINLMGEDRNSTIVDGGGNEKVVHVGADWVNITGLTITNGIHGLYLASSSNNNILNNNISFNGEGIELHSSINNNISGNHVSSNNGHGIYLWYSLNINITNNNLTYDGIVIEGTSMQHFNSHTIPDNNMVNEKPILYKKDYSNISIDSIPVGQLILVNCINVSVTNLQITNTDIGIDVVYSTNISFENNTITLNYHRGITLGWSSNITILFNNISNNGDNVSSPIGMGIMLAHSSNNNVNNNTISSNGFYGIYFYFSSNNSITNNTFTLNKGRGIEVGGSSNNNNITNNNISSNRWGIYIVSSNNNITNNNVISNINGGVFIWSSSNNRIYHNNIIGNTNQAYDDRNDNFWDNGYPSGGNYWSDFDESTEGAYDDYQGPNQDVVGSDGLVDNGSVVGGGNNPYIVDTDSQDNYPLISPFGNYIFLNEGWNLISIPFIQLDTNLSSVLNSITGYYKAVQWYNATDSIDHWKHNSISKPSELNDLDSINHKMGFWIYVTEPGGVLFQYFGMQPTENQSITIYPGWNLVGYPSLSNKNRTNAMNNLTFGTDVDSIWTYKASTQKWKEIGIIDYFEIGQGYWMHSKVTKVWNVPL